MLRDLVVKNRSTRRFRQGSGLDRAILMRLIDLARLSPSAANRQPLNRSFGDRPDVVL